jgi:glutaredoxin 3
MAETKKIKVTIYSLQGCPYCHMAKEYFKEKGIAYTDIDVTDNDKATEEMIKRSGKTGVPQIIIGKKIIVGFDAEAIEDALKKEAKK